MPEGKAGSPSLYAAREPVSSRQWTASSAV